MCNSDNNFYFFFMSADLLSACILFEEKIEECGGT